jgi:hypothetical protein
VISRYYSRAEIDPQRVHKDIGFILEEIALPISGLARRDAEVAVDIDARRPERLEEGTSRTLKSEQSGFVGGRKGLTLRYVRCASLGRGPARRNGQSPVVRVSVVSPPGRGARPCAPTDLLQPLTLKAG